MYILGAARTDGDAADEMMKALRRKDSSVLDILIECLKDQEEANTNLIKNIRAGWLVCVIIISIIIIMFLVFPEWPPQPPSTSETQPLTVYDDWPAPLAVPTTTHHTIPPPPPVRYIIFLGSHDVI